jgi:MFS transporter, MHS family, citrate/tricarballylate:H+ symporter
MMRRSTTKEAPLPDLDREVKLHHLPAVALGNALEFYDFLTYAFFAVHIAACLFPSSTPGVALLKSLATFGVGFLTRPLGGIVIGRMGDRLGRRPAMLLSFSLMGVSIVGLALTPSAVQIGWAAGAMAVFFRLLQGFALGGEVGPATAFLVEAAPLRWRGLVVSLQATTQYLALLVASLVGWLLSMRLSTAELDSYGWRVAFLLGAVVVPVGLWLRRTMPETRHHVHPVEPPPVRRVVALGCLLMISGTVQTYITAYLTTYAITSLHLAETLAFAGSVVSALVGLALSPAAAAMTDLMQRRRPLLVWPSLAQLLSTLPVFWLMVHFPGALSFLGGSLFLAVLGSLSPLSVVISEGLPQESRAGAFGIMYALMISCFGGTTQFVVRWLIEVTGNALAPAWYLSVALLLGFAASVGFPETAPGRGEPLRR